MVHWSPRGGIKKKKGFFLKLHCHSLYFFFFNLITCDAFLGAVRIQTDKTKRRRIVLQMEISVLLHGNCLYSFIGIPGHFWIWRVLEPLTIVNFSLKS